MRIQQESLTMKKALILILVFVHTNLFAGIKAYLDRQEIHSNESFTLVVELDEFTTDTPDLSKLPKELTLLSNSKYHRSSIINGVTKTELGWKIQLMAQKPGIYTIPSLTVAGQSSQPIQITVKAPSTNISEDGETESIMLKAEVSKPEVYVQEQVIYTLKLYRAVQTQYASLTEPNVQDAIIEKLGDDQQYESIINGQRYWILERKYAIFPQKSGELTIPKVIFSADVVESGSTGYGRILGRTRPVTITTDEITLKVKPYPANHSGLWLPSKRLTIESRWSDPNEKIVGEPSTWTITIKGVGLHENQLPELQLPPTEGIKWYPDTAQKDRTITQEGITGERIERIAVVPTKAGTLKLPEIKFRWFNTETEQYQEAVLPAQTITVLPNQNQYQAPVIIDTPKPESPPQESSPQNFWKWSTYGFAFLWLATLVLYLLQQNKPRYRPIETPQPKTAAMTSKERLLKACREQNNAAIYNALLNWLNEIAGKEQTLEQHLSWVSDPEIKQSLLELEQSLFSPAPKPWNHADRLKDGLKRIEQDIRSQPKSNKSNPLPELYPND
jgi:hypothetical protein